tara:strand:+ start:39 stop:1967 length:1929 start_codon:yes stop_codon:yes gene_type:complete
MADTSYFDRFFNSENNPAIESLKGLPSGILDTLNGLDAATLEYLESLEQDNSIPLTMRDQIGQNLGNTVPKFVDFGLDTGENIQKSIDEFLSGDSTTVSGLKDGSIKEGDVDLTGIDLVQVLGDNFGPSVPEEFKNVGPGQMNRFDPTGDNRSKSVELQKQIDALGTVGGRGEMVEGPEERANYIEKKRGEAAEAFRAQEKQLVDSQGGLNSMSIAESDSIVQDGFIAAMDDFFEGARGAGPEVPKKRTIAEYKKAFSEATGVDTSGKVDKSHALMAMGLALMQNKGGNIFTEIGIAGEKALPALEKAKERARQGALAGGKYALQTQSSDKAVRAAAEEKMLNRDKYWVYKKGTSDKPFEGFNTGQFEDLNKYELDKLMKDPKFQEQYEFVSSNDRMDVLAKREAAYIAANDLGEQWEKSEPVSLIGGKWEEAPEVFQVTSSNIKSNWKGDRSVLKLLGQDAKFTVRQFQSYQEDIFKDEKKFDELINNINRGVSIPGQIGGSIKEFFIGMGISGIDTSTPAKAKQALKNFAIDNATEILKESGKTLSDGDRKLVAQRVGEISWGNANPELIKRQIKDVYDLIVVKAQKNLDTAIENLNSNYGIPISSSSSNSGQSAPTKEEIVEFNKMYGTKFTMETFPKD